MFDRSVEFSLLLVYLHVLSFFVTTMAIYYIYFILSFSPVLGMEFATYHSKSGLKSQGQSPLYKLSDMSLETESGPCTQFVDVECNFGFHVPLHTVSVVKIQ